MWLISCLIHFLRYSDEMWAHLVQVVWTEEETELFRCLICEKKYITAFLDGKQQNALLILYLF